MTVKMISVKDTPPFKQVSVLLGDGFLQIEAGMFDSVTGKRIATYARRVYTDEGGVAILCLLDELADARSGCEQRIPVWEPGERIPGGRDER